MLQTLESQYDSLQTQFNLFDSETEEHQLIRIQLTGELAELKSRILVLKALSTPASKWNKKTLNTCCVRFIRSSFDDFPPVVYSSILESLQVLGNRISRDLCIQIFDNPHHSVLNKYFTLLFHLFGLNSKKFVTIPEHCLRGFGGYCIPDNCVVYWSEYARRIVIVQESKTKNGINEPQRAQVFSQMLHALKENFNQNIHDPTSSVIGIISDTKKFQLCRYSISRENMSQLENGYTQENLVEYCNTSNLFTFLMRFQHTSVYCGATGIQDIEVIKSRFDLLDSLSKLRFLENCLRSLNRQEVAIITEIFQNIIQAWEA